MWRRMLPKIWSSRMKKKMVKLIGVDVPWMSNETIREHHAFLAHDEHDCADHSIVEEECVRSNDRVVAVQTPWLAIRA